MKLIPATLETLEGLPKGAIVTPITEFYNDYVFLKHTASDDKPWSDVGVSEPMYSGAVLQRCTALEQEQLILLWPDEEKDLKQELTEMQDQLAIIAGKVGELDLSRTVVEGFLTQLRKDHDALSASFFDSRVEQHGTNRGFTNRIDAVSDRSSREEMRLSEQLEQQQALITELQYQLSLGRG